MNGQRVGVLGASSFVGRSLLGRLTREGADVVAFSRAHVESSAAVQWRQLPAGPEPVSSWVCVAPVWVVPEYFSMFEESGAQRIVVLSSTSRFTKVESGDRSERRTANRLSDAEECVRIWAESRGIEWVVLRPTLIYGSGADRNVADVARFIQRFRCFPVLGSAAGLRQPVHHEDVADACVAALRAPCANRAYNLSGGETLSYREMVERVFEALGMRPRVVSVPAGVLRAGVPLMRCLPRYRHVSLEMALRMNRDLVFDHADAARDLGFAPRAFLLSGEDVLASVM